MFSPKKNTYKGRAEMAEKLLASLVLKQPIQELRMQFLRRKLLPNPASKGHLYYSAHTRIANAILETKVTAGSGF